MSETPILFFSSGTCAFGSIVAFEWSGIPYKLCRADRAERATEAFKKFNPLGQVPALKTPDGCVVTENSAILKHIAAHAADKNLDFKAGTPESDKMNTCLSWYGSNFHPAFWPYFAPQRFHDDEKVQAQLKEKAIENIRNKYHQLNSWFGGQDRHFDKPTIVDGYAYGMLRWGAKFIDLAKDAPNVAKFMAAQEKDLAVKFALAIEKGENAKTTGQFQGMIALDEVKAPEKKAA